MIKKRIYYSFLLLIVWCMVASSHLVAKNWQAVQEESRDAIVHLAVVIKKFHWFNPYIINSSEQVTGSGFFIDEDGSIITCSHVVEDAIAVFVIIPALGKQFLKAHVTSLCPKHDIALLHLDEESLSLVRRKLGEVPYLTFGDSDLVKRGEEILALGYPETTLETHQLKGTAGVISARLNRVFQCDAALNPGNSGGPVLEQNGNVIGIASAVIRNAQNINFAIPINMVKSLLPTLYETRLVRVQSLEIVWSYSTEEIKKYLNVPDKEGCLICDASLTNPAHFQVYDIISQVNGYPVDNYGEIMLWTDGDSIRFDEYVFQLPLGTSVTFDIYRNAQPLQLHMVIDKGKEGPIEMRYPAYEKIDYEVFAGMIIMPLTINYINNCVQSRPSLQRYATNLYCHGPRLVIADIIPNSQMAQSKTMGWGNTINEINGEKVYTLNDFRRTLQKSILTGIVTIKTTDESRLLSNNLLSVLSLYDSCKETVELSYAHGYPVSETIVQLLKEVE